MNECFLQFASEEFDRLLRELVGLHSWDCGICFTDLVVRRPQFHLAEFGHDQLTVSEIEAGHVWYNTPPEVRVKKLRSIYPYNIVNERQLSHPVKLGRLSHEMTLRELIENESIGTLEALPGGRLWLWRVPGHEQRVALRRQLHWKVADWRLLRKGQIDWSEPGIVIDAATLIP